MIIIIYIYIYVCIIKYIYIHGHTVIDDHYILYYRILYLYRWLTAKYEQLYCNPRHPTHLFRITTGLCQVTSPMPTHPKISDLPTMF